MLWICAENSIDNTGMFLLLLSSAYAESGPFVLLTPPQQWGGSRRVPCRMTSHSVCKSGRGRQKGGRLERWRLSSQVTIRRDGALLSWGWLNTCLPMGSREWFACFALVACVAFALPVKLSLSQPVNFLTLTLPILSPIPLWGKWASGCVVLSCWLGLNHNRWCYHAH